MRISQADVDAFPRFCYVPDNYYVVDSLCFFSGKGIQKLVQVLNSEYAAWYFFKNVAVLDNGGFQMRQQYVEEMPIPTLNLNSSENIDEQIFKEFQFSNAEVSYIRNSINETKAQIVSAR